MKQNNLILAFVLIAIGFITAYFVLSHQTTTSSLTSENSNQSIQNKNLIANPFSEKNTDVPEDARLHNIEIEISQIKNKLKMMESALEQALQKTNNTADTAQTANKPVAQTRNRFTSALSQRLYSLDNLIKGGIDPSQAEDIVRRKNSIELKRLALQDKATREAYLNSQRYFDELSEINALDVTLREELGDERYDEYLYNSKQNNRIRISSIMLGSAAEQAGIQKGDVVLSYDNQKMYSWQELKDATSEGQLGEYVSISIYRNGEIYSFSVPRGPLGMQLGATRLEP
jgi:C-terminal processing protease CtpA/Prc